MFIEHAREVNYLYFRKEGEMLIEPCLHKPMLVMWQSELGTWFALTPHFYIIGQTRRVD